MRCRRASSVGLHRDISTQVCAAGGPATGASSGLLVLHWLLPQLLQLRCRQSVCDFSVIISSCFALRTTWSATVFLRRCTGASLTTAYVGFGEVSVMWTSCRTALDVETCRLFLCCILLISQASCRDNLRGKADAERSSRICELQFVGTNRTPVDFNARFHGALALIGMSKSVSRAAATDLIRSACKTMPVCHQVSSVNTMACTVLGLSCFVA